MVLNWPSLSLLESRQIVPESAHIHEHADVQVDDHAVWAMSWGMALVLADRLSLTAVMTVFCLWSHQQGGGVGGTSTLLCRAHIHDFSIAESAYKIVRYILVSARVHLSRSPNLST